IRAGRPVAVIHGDWHFGQLVALPGAGWRLIDVDDLGLGDPAWDLARPAAWFAAGLLPVDLWARFVDAYAAGGGPAVTDWADPWPALDLPARFRTVEYAATALAAHFERPPDAGLDAGLDPVSAAFVESCARIAGGHGPESGS
ncbi:aminoglycoside phosphotransferase family protein, partial [Frankia sp. AgKG'84/4]|uniref:phosphotransferase family protein n=1 Tax=Frankia sp. AgKG'84/4 TaxID=573490 RepID=UPI00202A8D4B|nr:aminoglycoside phosphotransferase family protein [Frankia sp. AgKG'84/4]